MENKLIIPAIVSRYAPRADKSWNISLNVNEPTAEQKLIIDRFFQQACVVMIKDTGINKADEDIIDSIDLDLDNSKTPSQRLRGTLYRNWEQDNKGHQVFKDYYKEAMEKIIVHFKNKLD
jgi:hypothetical protein